MAGREEKFEHQLERGELAGGVMREHRGPLCQAIEASTDGKGETAYFSFKCFKNGNLHITMKRLDLVKELNGLAAGEYVLGEDME